MPRSISRDEAAERRAANRTDQRRYGHQRHGVDQKPFVDAAHQDEAADRRHHRAAGTLNNARHHELLERARQRAADRAKHEHDDGAAEHVARAETVGHPAAGGNENGKREQIGRDGELQRQRIGAERDCAIAGSDVAITVESMFSMNKATATISGTTRS